MQDSSAEAYETIVDFYVKTQYGEHMARYWLDLVRFAIPMESSTTIESRLSWLGHEAFNSNLSYDAFVRQLAGDLVEQPQAQQLVASGLIDYMIIDRGTMLPEESLARNVIDRVTSVGTAFMGPTVGCAVCHDHKYIDHFKEFFQICAFSTT